jgi:hypothetical protein
VNNGAHASVSYIIAAQSVQQLLHVMHAVITHSTWQGSVGLIAADKASSF